MIGENNTVLKWKSAIPNTWRLIPLKYIVSYNNKTLPEDTDDAFEFDYIDISSVTYQNGIEQYQPMSFGEAPSRARRIVEPNDVILSTVRTYLKASAKIEPHDKPLIASTGFITMRAGDGISSEYLGYLAKSDGLVSEIECKSYGVSYPAIKPTEVIQISVPLPPLSEQRAIVAYLDEKCAAIDESIQKRKEIIEKLEDYKRATIIHTSLSGLNSNVDFKPTEIPWLKSVPSKWNVLPLRFMFIERKDKNKEGAETNLLSLSYGRIKRKDINSNEGLTPDNYNGYNIVQQGDIVLRLTDLQNDHRSLRTGLVTEKGIITSAYVTLKPLHSNINSPYFRYVLHAYDLMKVFYSMGEGIRQSLKYDDLSRTVFLPIPLDREQADIVRYLQDKEATINTMISKQQTIIDKLEEYKKSIIYNAVTGKIDCRPS